ncbi:MAG TPA: D-Ala-D-Ala carboxypeptidase family metallohydrolase, partial [Gemmatimonadales bacterium]|nr:D-Ala-D-Ala carboxypeptidase family metallohydrolase [Gemmatimonadales bacterium]
MRLTLGAALLGATALSIGEYHRGHAPPPVRDLHDTVVAVPDSALVPKTTTRAALRGRVSFAVKFKEEVSPYPLLAMFVMPGERVPLEAVLTDSTVRYTARATAGRLARLGPSRWQWTAPKKTGLYPVWVRDSASGETVTLNAFVLVPFPNAGTIGEFMVGRYESRPLRGNPSYARPTGFIEVTEANRGTFVAPHFTLEQFVSKQRGGYPKYLVLRERLLLKLEMLLEEARSAGIAANTFRILSGYRTPFYNRSIGNETRYSRHVYGDAADIYVDDDGDGTMDDVNQ